MYKWQRSSWRHSLGTAQKPHREGKTGQKFSTWILSINPGLWPHKESARQSWTLGQDQGQTWAAGPHQQHLQASALDAASPTGYPIFWHDCCAPGGLGKCLQLARIWVHSSWCWFYSINVHLFWWPTGTVLSLKCLCKLCIKRGIRISVYQTCH